MKLETYAKIAIVFGIAISCILAGIVLSYSLGDILNRYGLDEQIAWAFINKDEIKQQMMETSSYKSFIERFPDYREEIFNDRYRMQLSVEEINSTTMNSLQLKLSYTLDRSNINEDVICRSLDSHKQISRTYETAFTDVFIKTTDCLEADFKFSTMVDAWQDSIVRLQ